MTKQSSNLDKERMNDKASALKKYKKANRLKRPLLIALSFLITTSASWGAGDDQEHWRHQKRGEAKENQMLWQPSPSQMTQANLTRFIEKIRQEEDPTVSDYQSLYTFSLNHPESFWKAVWSFCNVLAETQGAPALINADKMMMAKFFPNARLNYAENLLRRRDNAVAITFYSEDKVYKKLTFQDLYQDTAKLADVFQKWGIKPGDRIAGYLPNMPETLIAMLATTSMGAVWSSCSPDFAVTGAASRFSQITPKVLLMADQYYYKGKAFDRLKDLSDLRSKISSVEKVIVIPYLQTNNISGPFERWDKTLASSQATSINFNQLPFNHPLFILYSSGTNGEPKCIVHGAGGTLLQHLKEHQLHCDIKPGDQVFYHTTCGWMMWNWLVSALASQASLVLYDGSPEYPHPEALLEIASRERVTLFGTSATYIDNLAKAGAKPVNRYPFPKLRMIASTGSPLAPENFDYIYGSVKRDVLLASISGGTDIISCFALGNPINPVWRGELQSRGLGLAVNVFNEEGKPITKGKGELVCTKPFPSQPLGFWNDPKDKKYHEAYFDRFPNVWHHGDFVELTAHDGLIIHGRSDTVLNPGGVRIGTAEIYRHIKGRIPEMKDCVAVGQKWKNDERVILFVKLEEGHSLSPALIQKINHKIRSNETPRHVPSLIIAVPDIPRTKNDKLVERAVRDIIHGEVVKNQDALANPKALDYFQNLPELSRDHQKMSRSKL